MPRSSSWCWRPAGLWTALFTHDFSLKFVASYTSANLPKVYLFSAFWAGQSGSLLFWGLILAIFSAIAVFANRARNRELMPWVTGTLGVIIVFFIGTIIFAANPYERLDWVPPDGRGMNPQLQNPGMAIHPPMLYLGWVGTAIPFAFAVGALVTRRLDTEWLGAIRRWSLISWFFLTIRPGARHVVGVRGTRVGWLLGVGSGRECTTHVVALPDRVPALDHDPGKARHAAQVERDIGDRGSSSSASSAPSSPAAA